MTDTPYQRGLEDGHSYYRTGLDKGDWAYPAQSPFTPNSEADHQWWRGFDDGSSDAESAWEAEFNE